MYNLCQRGVSNICAKMGRPKLDDPKTTCITLKVDKETLNKLDEIVKANSLTRSQVIRQGIELLYRHIKK